MDDPTTIAALEQRVAELEALVARLADDRTVIAEEPEPALPAPLDDVVAQSNEPATFDRRRLLTRGGTAAAGAVLGGVAATIVTAAPAAAATGSFDSATTTTALTATNTGGGSAIAASGNGAAPVLEVTGTSSLWTVKIDGGDGDMGLVSEAKKWGVYARADGPVGFGVGGYSDGGLFGVAGSGSSGAIGVGGHSDDGLGGYLWGQAASLLLGPLDTDAPDTAPPRGQNFEHRRGEVAFDINDDLWLCTASGNPGTWVRVSGAGTTGPLTMLATPTRVYDTRADSGLPGAGTGPVTGVRHDIDLTANGSGLPVDATAALVTLTVTNTIANLAAYGQIYANGLATPPGTSTINWTQSNDVIATTTTTALTDGKVAISMNPGANVLIDVLGYYR